MLGLNNNVLTSLPVELCHLNELQILGLEGNKIQRIPPEIGNLYNLMEVRSNKLLTSGRDVTNVWKAALYVKRR